MSRLGGAVALVVAVARAADDNDVRYPAAALAYYTFISLLPILVLVVAFFGQEAATWAGDALPRLLTLEAQLLIRQSLATATGRTGATVLAVGVLLWGGANVVVGFLTVVDRVEGATDASVTTDAEDAKDAKRRTRAERVRNAVVVVGSLSLAIVAVALTGQFYASVTAGTLLQYAWPIVMFATLVAVFVPLYSVPSRLASTPGAALPGAAFAAFGWTVLVVAIQLYAAYAAEYALYGVLGGIILIFTALYLAAFALLVGVVVNATLVRGSWESSPV